MDKPRISKFLSLILRHKPEEAGIVLDENGVCNHCLNAQKSLKDNESEKENLSKIIEAIKKGKGKYNCLIGLSGGVDSSYTLHHLVSLGFKPLCFSIDNGWNNPLADENIMRLVETLKVPFYRYTIDLKKFRELQGAFIQAGLINLEIPTDHILLASSYEMADKYGIKFIISGGNTATESIMPASWSYAARDLVHIKDVYQQTIGKKLTGIPMCGLLKWNWYKWIKGIKTLYLLDYLSYNREEAIKLLEEKYGWKNYGDKHEESIFTRWYQNFYLFHKFGIDKRKAHYASLINSGQMTREEAMFKLTASPVYPELGLEARVMNYRKRSHYDFKTDEKLFNFLSKIIRKLPRKWRS